MESLPLSMLAGIEKLDATQQDWSLLGPPGEGDNRRFVHEVKFDRDFSAAPLVHLGVVGFDISNEDYARLKVRPAAITPGGFAIVAETWLSTQIFGIEVSWIAIGS